MSGGDTNEPMSSLRATKEIWIPDVFGEVKRGLS